MLLPECKYVLAHLINHNTILNETCREKKTLNVNLKPTNRVHSAQAVLYSQLT